MNELLSYKEARINALLERVIELEQEKEMLTTFVFELCDKDCPEDYKKVVIKEVFDND